MISHRKILFIFLLLPITANASFIEATIGTAVVNDATAAYYNPAALTLLKNPQIIGQGSVANFRTQFTGQATLLNTNFTQSGTTNTQTHYFLPSGYFAFPATKQFYFGVAVVANSFNRDIDSDSILRYVQSSNNIQNIDFVPALGIKLNDYLSLGAGLNFSRAEFLLEPTSGAPGLNIPDNESRNASSGSTLGGDVGLLLKPTPSTLIGFNYRSALSYKLTGTSTLEGTPSISSDHYSFNFWTPARYVVSVSQSINKKFGLIGTVQWVQWDIFDKINIHNIATQIGSQAVILPNATVPYHLHNSWIFTAGANYRITPKWVIRAASSYMQSPANQNFQIANGDSIILGASTAYEITKRISIDGSYAHAFIKNQDINIANSRTIVTGVNKGMRDAVSLKLTFNI